MNLKKVLAFLGAAAVSSMALADSALPVSVSADGNTVLVQGNASPVVHLTVAQAKDAVGSFALQDGRTLRLTSRNSTLFMEVDGKREKLLPLSPTEFVARDSGARLALDQQAYPDKVLLTQFRR
ncbi:hypothetical protein AB595_28350 [Massilia sp. WF1]|uniref:hypothetical protein n=1 Tax=unclassified Massilia TaxID=2609279 RepID=UPI00068D4B0F|nr:MULTISPECIES: hypothetical protein [unclassified Massilia]ALK96124.1 hypothetical protein AM586_07365 [Massilia sp. WG5]KNZ67299.1 hypothetical protein AB595_28350 [Massilia sp. WF1]